MAVNKDKKVRKVAKPPMEEVASIRKDFDIYWGWINRLENPDPVMKREAYGRGLKLYDEVDRDAHAGSVLQQRYMAVVGKDWAIIPAKTAIKKGRPASTSQEQVVADFVTRVLTNCNFDEARLDLLKSILYGFWTVEVLWKPENGNIVIERFRGKHPRRFIFTPERDLHLLLLRDLVMGVEVPPRKFVIMQYGDSDIPYGKGLGQRIWWPMWFKKNGVKFWMIFLEKFGMPTVKGKYPPGTDLELQKNLMEAIESIQTDTGVKMPDNMDIEFLEASRAGTATYEELCNFMDKQVSKAVLGQTASTEGTPGKLGNEKDQADVRQEIIEADADLLDTCLNEQLIKWIVDLNFPGVTAYPKIVTYAHAKPNLESQSKVDKTLAIDIGLPMTKAYFYETYGIPVPQEDEECVVITVKNPADPTTAATFAEMTTDDWIDSYMDSIRPSLQNAHQGALDEIESYLKSQSSPPAEAEFISKVQGILGAALSVVDRAAIAATVAKIYKTFRGPTAFVGMGGPDLRAMNFLSKLDSFYVSKWIQNPDAISAVKQFLSERYLEQGAGIFGRQAPQNLEAFRNLFEQKLADLEDWQVGRIIDTSVVRVQNWAALAQLHEGGITELEVYEPTQECDFCKEMNGNIISVPTAYKTMTRQAGLTPDVYAEQMKATVPATDNTNEIAAKGILPPYHPHCRGIVIKHVKRTVA